MENSSYTNSSADDTSNFSIRQISVRSQNALANSNEKAEQEIWGEILGDEKPWEKMTSKEKTVRCLLNWAKMCAVLCFLYFFICSLDMLSMSFRLLAGKSTGNLMNNEYITNPIVGLMIGILLTVLVQSSSTSTSIIVSMVAAGILTVHVAVPMVMGANIGTSVTNTIVSLTQVGDREQFRRAFAGATVHDMFNWLSVIILLTLEILTGAIEKLTSAIIDSLSNRDGVEVQLLSVLTDPFIDLIIQLDSEVVECWGMGFMQDTDSMIKKYCGYIPINITSSLTTQTFTTTVAATLVTENGTVGRCEPNSYEIGLPHSCKFLFYETTMSDTTVGFILLVISLAVLCTSLILIVKILNSMLKGSMAKIIKKVINADIPYLPFLTGYVAIVIGAILTFIVQSSSVFTSTLTPLIGLGIISVERAYPLTLGSNIGTTTTSLLAAMASSGEQIAAIQIALVHLFFNVFGIMIFYPIPFMRFPIPMCKKLGDITANYRWFAVVYIILMFFLLPGSIFALSLGGTIVMWSILGPIIILLIVVVIINVIQSKHPDILPKRLQSWDFLPEPMRSLGPYDHVFTSMPCCRKCRANVEPENLVEVGCAPRTSVQGITNTVSYISSETS